MQTQSYGRKPFQVDAVQVTEENIEQVATWCGGTIVEADEKTAKHIKVKVHRPLNEKQTQAMIGDWVLNSSTGFKVYTNRAFLNSFEPNEEGDELRSNVFEEHLEELRSVGLPVDPEPEPEPTTGEKLGFTDPRGKNLMKDES